MKYILSIICMMCLLVSCGIREKNAAVRQSYTDLIDKYFEGNHDLKTMKTTTIESASYSASYFLIAANAKATAQEEREVTFMWDTGGNNYAICTAPLTKFHVKFDETVEHPYIRFKYYHGSGFRASDAQRNIEECVIYILVVCKESDWVFAEKFTL